MEVKTCSKCHVEKSLTEYFKRGGKQQHLYKSSCKKCMMKLRLDWANENRERVRELCRKSRIKAGRRFKRHNITEEQWLDVVKKQNGLCAICEEEDELVIDHNHDTNEFRGALCRNCNRALGLMKDSIKILDKAVEYLRTKGSYGDIDGSKK